MKRLITGFAVVGLMLALLPNSITPISRAASNTATTLFPVDEVTQLETHSLVECHVATGSCDFTAGANLRTHSRKRSVNGTGMTLSVGRPQGPARRPP